LYQLHTQYLDVSYGTVILTSDYDFERFKFFLLLFLVFCVISDLFLAIK
jgi:hypothetical protein